MAEWARVAGMDFSRATYKDLAVQTFMAISLCRRVLPDDRELSRWFG